MKQDPSYASSVLKDLEAQADEIKHPSRFLISTLKKDGMLFGWGPPAVVGKAKGKGYGSEYSKPSPANQALQHERIEKRAAWLSANVFWNGPIDEEAVAAMKGMGVTRAMELFSELEAKAPDIKNPSGYLKTAAKREGFGPPDEKPRGGGSEKPRGGGNEKPRGGGNSHNDNRIRKRGNWLNNNVFTKKPIDDDALEAMCSLELGKAMEIFNEIEAAGAEVRNPGAYLMSAVRREQTKSWSEPRGVKRSSATALSVKTEQAAGKPKAAKKPKMDIP